MPPLEYLYRAAISNFFNLIYLICSSQEKSRALWSLRRDLDPRPLPYQGNAPPGYEGNVCSRERITPPNKTLAVQASIETNPEPKKTTKTNQSWAK